MLHKEIFTHSTVLKCYVQLYCRSVKSLKHATQGLKQRLLRTLVAAGMYPYRGFRPLSQSLDQIPLVVQQSLPFTVTGVYGGNQGVYSQPNINRMFNVNQKSQIIPNMSMPPSYSNRALNDVDVRESIRTDILRQIKPDCPLITNDTSLHDNSILQAKRSKRHLDTESNVVEKKVKSSVSSNQTTAHPSWPIESGWEQPSHFIWQYFLQNQQTEDTYHLKIQLRDALFAVLQGVFPYCGLYVVGSSMSGFATTKSDMDLCLMVSSSEIDQRKEATEILSLIFKAFKGCTFIRRPNVIRAKVPILNFWDDISGAECDLNINNSVGIRNTHLLKHYAMLDWRVRPLVLFTKQWTRYHDINNAKKQTMSSYSLSLMLIHYLQAGCSPPVLPSLQKLFPDKFSSSVDLQLLRLVEEATNLKPSRNKQSLGELFLGFLQYYAMKFNYDSDAISVRLGTKVPKRMLIKQSGNVSQWTCICIEEPFDLSNTARSAYDEDTFQRVKRVFRTSYIRLSKTRDVKAILSVPF